MSILIPVYSKGITFNEVPDHIAVYFEISNCQKKCKGCHSPFLQEHSSYMTLEDMVAYADKMQAQGADAIVLLGGTTNGITYGDLYDIIAELNGIAPVALYSGSDNTERDLELLIDSRLTWLKTGSYQEDKGGLSSSTTNQHFYEKVFNKQYQAGSFKGFSMEIKDKTDIFLKKYGKS